MKVSLVIPVFNEEAEIATCLDSVAAQELPPDEVIVVDNNSTDKTVEIAKKYPFVRIIKEQKQGVDYARDAGFNAAKHDIIARTDADAVLPARWTRAVVELFGNDPELAAVSGPAYFKDMPAPAVSAMFDRIARGGLFNPGKMVFLFGCNMAMRKSAWQEVRDNLCHLDSMHEDVDLGIHVAQAGMKVMFDKNLLVGTSARRMSDGATGYYKYLRMNGKTFAHHGIDIGHIVYPYTALFAILYPGVSVVQRAYDPKNKRLSLKKLLTEKPKKRKNPMARV